MSTRQSGPSQPQQGDIAPVSQDVLAEARNNLQLLIDSNLSQDFLQEWIDETESPNLSFALQRQEQSHVASLPPVPVGTATSSHAGNNHPMATTPPVDSKDETFQRDITSSLPLFTLRHRTAASSTSFDNASMLSGSSGRASVWSTNSGRSSMSWLSTTSMGASAQTPAVAGPVGPAIGAVGRSNVYWCTSCDTSFKRRYDWKRHEDELHERWREYPCPEPECNRTFWGPNSFNQHHKQFHGCKTCPHAEKVVKVLRKRKYWSCGFCSALHPARERHIEHVAHHFESGMTNAEWMHSRVIYGLLHQPLVHESWLALMTRKQSEYKSRRRPQFSWHVGKTGRSEKPLDGESSGKLQDLLEFFSGDETEAQQLASQAYDLAEIHLTSEPIPPQYSEGFDPCVITSSTQSPLQQTMDLPGLSQQNPTPSLWSPPIPPPASHSKQELPPLPKTITEVDFQSFAPSGASNDWETLASNVNEGNTWLVERKSNMVNMPLPRQKTIIRVLVEDLVSKMGPLIVDKNMQKNFLAKMPELLDTFALRVGHNGPTQMHRDVMISVRRHRHQLAAAFKSSCLKKDEGNLESAISTLDDMTLQDRMSLWKDEEVFQPPHYEKMENVLAPEDIYLQARDGEAAEAEFIACKEFISHNEAYEWLLSRLRRELHLVPAIPNVMGTIRNEIMASLSSFSWIHNEAFSPRFFRKFYLEWDIFGFFETQEYSGQPHEVFEGVITLTGSEIDAQATTCAQYIHQTWPLTGKTTLQLIKDILKDKKTHSCTFSDGTELTAFMTGREVVASASGPAASISEIGEQLAWLGAALRTSPQLRRLVHCTPKIVVTNQRGLLQSWSNPIFRITFEIYNIQKSLGAANGQCWHNIFRNPVVVQGYPIRRRPEWNTGLEIPLNMMAGLSRASRVDQFNNKTIIKGFSTMLVPTKLNEDVFCWHLIYTKDGSRISYLDDCDGVQGQKITRQGLENYRHVLGWSKEFRFYAGSTQQGKRPVAYSRLPKPPTSCPLAKTKVSAGRIITDGPQFQIGVKDIPVRISHEGYLSQLEWIHTKFVLLWDVSDERGWLINGTSALLHLVIESLEHDRTGLLQDRLRFDPEDLEESDMPLTASSAIKVLSSTHNRDLRLYDERDGNVFFQSRVEHFYNLLEKLIDHQADIAGDCGKSLRRRSREHLEGWDFENLALRTVDPMNSCAAILQDGAKSWIDLTRAVQAVTLLGRGFGEIIQPAAGICSQWAKLPKKQSYLACCLSDMNRVIRQHGNYDNRQVWFTDDLIWHAPVHAFESCRCNSPSRGLPCQPVQTVFPSALSSKLLDERCEIPREGCGEPVGPDEQPLVSEGALIFGYNSRFPWIWGSHGHPQPGHLEKTTSSPSLAETDSVSSKDSGIGSSLATSESERLDSPESRTGSPGGSLTETTTPDTSAFIQRMAYPSTTYKVGIICALPKEHKAVRALLDSNYEDLPREPGDSNHYVLGKMGGHMVVTVCLPYHEHGNNSATSVATHMKRSFPSIEFCLLVGIGGGVPSEEKDIRLGDVVVGLPEGEFSGVIQWDRGKKEDAAGFKRTSRLHGPPLFLATAISKLLSTPRLQSDPLGQYLKELSGCLPEYRYPAEDDVLYDDDHPRQRARRQTNGPEIHYGLVGSGNSVIKSARDRDKLSGEPGMLCFEMEAAGVVNEIPCLVVRGICDYCDKHKNDVWQNYAAATAAAYSKLLLTHVAKEARGYTPLGNLQNGDKSGSGLKRRWLMSEEVDADRSRWKKA